MANPRFHPIPPITDPMGQHWRQPSRFDIEVDDTHALMSQKTFDKLAEYSSSVPSGVYPGKMWKRRVFYLKRFEQHKKDTFLLCWFGEHQDPKLCSNHTRKILIA